jgi:hypothetical protein
MSVVWCGLLSLLLATVSLSVKALSRQQVEDVFFSPKVFLRQAIDDACDFQTVVVPLVPIREPIEPIVFWNVSNCILEVSRRFYSIKQGEFLGLVPLLDQAINAALYAFGAKQFNPLSNHLEGNVLGFPEKLSILQHYANDPRVETICEVGFNAGYSSLYMALQNPIARFFEFDVFYHNYSAVALSSLQELFFPDRDFVGIAGLSSISVHRFHRMFPSTTCNLIFIDGGHSTSAFRADLTNFAHLANRTFHRVIIDDTTPHNNLNEEYFSWVVANISEHGDKKMIYELDEDLVRQSRKRSSRNPSEKAAGESIELRHIDQHFMNSISAPCISWQWVPHETTSWLNYVQLSFPEVCTTTPIEIAEVYDGDSGITVAEYIF